MFIFEDFKSRPKYNKHLQKRYRSSYFARLFLDEIQQQKSTHPNSESKTLTFLSNFLHLWRSSFPLRFWHSSSKASSGLVSSLTWFLWLPRNLEAENPTENPLNIKPSGAHNTRCFFSLLSFFVFDQRPHKWVFGRTVVSGKYDTSLVSKRTQSRGDFLYKTIIQWKIPSPLLDWASPNYRPNWNAPKMLPMALMDLLPLKHPSTSK